MDSKHLLCFGAGVLVGWIVLPMVINMFTKK